MKLSDDRPRGHHWQGQGQPYQSRRTLLGLCQGAQPSRRRILHT
eukprot:05499.XXX_296637_296768_1 [CDS] Oithona nana genome sequencing.